MDHELIDLLTEHLRSLNCGDAEIKAVIARVSQFDKQMIHGSVFESIESGSFNLQAIIDEVRVANSDEGTV